MKKMVYYALRLANKKGCIIIERSFGIFLGKKHVGHQRRCIP